MPGDFAVAASGFRVATERFETSVNNLVNANSTAQLETDGSFSNTPYRPQTVQPVTQPQGGVTSVTVERDNPTVPSFEPSNSLADENGFVETPNVDVAEEAVNQIIASYDAQANLSAIRIQDEILEATVDILA